MKALDNSLHPFRYESVWKKWNILIDGQVDGTATVHLVEVFDFVNIAVGSIHENIRDGLLEDV